MNDAPQPDRAARRAAARRRRWAVLGAVVVVIAVAVVAVVLLTGGDSDDGTDEATGTDTPTNTADAGDPDAPDAPPPTNDAEPLRTGVCSADQLTGEMVITGLEVQTSAAVIAVTNRSESSCTLNGTPELTILGEGGGQPTVSTPGGGAISPDLVAQEVTLEPGGQASFKTSWVSVAAPGSGDATCSKGDALRVRPPDSDGGVRVEMRITACFGGSMNVSPFQPGVIAL